MLVDVPAYRIFFELLWKKFCFKEFNDDNPIPQKVTDIWEDVRDHNGRSEFITQLRFSATPLYFYKLRPPKKVKAGEFEISDISLAKALAYIEDEEDKLEKRIFIEWEKEASQRWQRFKEKYAPEKLKPVHPVIDGQNSHTAHLDSLSADTEAFKTVEKLITDYFENITAKRFFEAWNQLTPNYQANSILAGNFEKFKAGFAATISISDLSIFNFKFYYSCVKCYVFFVEEVFLYPDINLEDPDIKRAINKKIQEAGLFVNISYVKEILAEIITQTRYAERHKLKHAENPLEEDEPGRYISPHYMSVDALQAAFPNAPIFSDKKIYEYTCCFFEGRWLINDIAMVNDFFMGDSFRPKSIS